MKRGARLAILLIAAMLALSIPASAAVGTTYHAPVLTMVSEFAPRDMKVTIRLVKRGETIPVVLNAQRRAWESQFRLYREGTYSIGAWFGNTYDLKDAELVVEGAGETRTIPIAPELLTEGGAEDYLSLNWRTGQLKPLSPWRAPLIAAMWIAVALLIEGTIFYAYGYRNRESWIRFLLINIVTQGAQHMIIAGLNVDTNRVKAYIFSIPLLFLIEIVVFIMAVDERNRDRTVSFVGVSNLVSQTALGLLPMVLPA